MTQPLERTTLKGGDTVLHARTTLVFYHRDGAQVAQLEMTRPLIVGRAAPADVEIPDPGLSRQHARFTWDDHGIWLEDLNSTNGTKKNGAPISERTHIMPGDEIAIGPVMVSVHVISSIDDELRGFDGHDRFVAALVDEITRARTFQRPLALLMVRSNKEIHVSRWAGRLRMALRPVDRVGIYGPSAVLVALPEATPDMVRAVTAAMTGGEPPLVCGAVSYPADGGSVDELIAALQLATRARGRAPTARDAEPPAVVIKNPAMKAVMSTVKRLTQSTINVLIHGETGTGKEVLARAIHDGGPRKKHPLRSVNCAAIPGTLIESMLFGHEQGAFTGADKPARGIFEQAEGGTVLLDEIGELAASAQAALLRVLETRKVTRVGGEKEIAVDVRVIAATHRDLEGMVDAGRFRQDLLYRLNTVTVRLPPLRERVDEIRPLAERFLKEARKQSGSEVRTIDPQALAALEAYAWPGNVRELRNVIERAVVLAEGAAIRLEDLTDRVRGSRASGARIQGAPLDPVRSTGQIPAPLDGSHTGPILTTGALSGATPGATPGGDPPGDYKEHVRRYEAELILRALHKANGNQTEAAKALNLPLRTLVHKIQSYGIKKKFDR